MAAAAAARRSSHETHATLVEGGFAGKGRNGELGNQPGRLAKFAMGFAPGCCCGRGTAEPPAASTCGEPPPVSTPTSECPPINPDLVQQVHPGVVLFL